MTQHVTKVIISAHGDTNWTTHHLTKGVGVRTPGGIEEEEYYGHMDNFGGVHATMMAYFSGKLPQDKVRIEITYGEETGMDGAKEVANTIESTDVVIVVDVTGTKTTSNIVIEKCFHSRLRKLVSNCLKDSNITFDLYRECPDPIAIEDETFIYSNITDYCFFLGLPVRGGDYNAGAVYCFKEDIEKLSEALVLLTHSILDNFIVEKPSKNVIMIEEGAFEELFG